MSGRDFITLQRRSLDSWLWDLPAEQTKVAVTLLLLANWKEGTTFSSGQLVKVNRGQVMTSLESLAKRARVSIRTVRTSLKNLEKAGFLTNKSTNKFRILTILNYDREQSQEERERQADRQAPDKQATSARQAPDNDITREPVNKGTKEPERTPPLPSESYNIASFLCRCIADRQPRSEPARQPDRCIKRWAPDVDKIHRLDGRPWDDIHKILKWSQQNLFWRKNIMSGAKLRKQFDALEADMLKDCKEAPRDVTVGRVEAKSYDDYPEPGGDTKW